MIIHRGNDPQMAEPFMSVKYCHLCMSGSNKILETIYDPYYTRYLLKHVNIFDIPCNVSSRTQHNYIYIYTWLHGGFLKYWYPYIIHFHRIFREINQPPRAIPILCGLGAGSAASRATSPGAPSGATGAGASTGTAATTTGTVGPGENIWNQKKWWLKYVEISHRKKKHQLFPCSEWKSHRNLLSHRIHVWYINANIKGVYWWDPCYHI